MFKRSLRSIAGEILQQIDGLDGQHEYGVGLGTLQAVLDNIREEERQAREATVPAAALETALKVAWDFMRLEDAKSGEGTAARLYPEETAPWRWPHPTWPFWLAPLSGC